MKTLCVIACLALITISCAFAADDVWLTDFEAARKAAETRQQPILMLFTGSDWCPWCKKLNKEALGTETFTAYAKTNLVLFIADFPRLTKLPDNVKKQNETLAQEFGIEGFPTVVLVDSTKKELGRTGYQAGGAEKYVEHLKEMLASKTKGR